MKRATGSSKEANTSSGNGTSSRLYKGIAVSLLIPAVILVFVLLRQFGGETKVAASDGGAPLEVAVRETPVVLAPKPRIVLNRTITFNKTNPYARARPVAKKKIISQINKTQRGSSVTTAKKLNQSIKVLKPWDLREIHASKKKTNRSIIASTKKSITSPNIPKHSKIVLPQNGKHTTSSATDSKNTNDKLTVAAKKPKKVFAASTKGKGYLPGEEILPSGGIAITSLKGLQKWIEKAKCVSLVAFYNSEDFAKSKELAAVWSTIHEQYKDKFSFGLCDIQQKDAMEVAVAAHVFPTANDTFPAIGLPSILAYPTKGYVNETVTILRGARAKKTSSTATPLVVSKTLLTVLSNLQLGISKDGCYAPATTPYKSKSKLLTSIIDRTKFRKLPKPFTSTNKKADDDKKKIKASPATSSSSKKTDSSTTSTKKKDDTTSTKKKDSSTTMTKKTDSSTSTKKKDDTTSTKKKDDATSTKKKDATSTKKKDDTSTKKKDDTTTKKKDDTKKSSSTKQEDQK